MQNKILRANRIYPWLAGLTNNLVFYIVINTVWLTNVKGFDATQVVFLEVCVGLAVRVIMSPVLQLAERIGNTWSMRLGVIALFATSILLTFGTEYWVFMLAMVLQAFAVVLTAMRDVLIQNNLNYLHQGKEYIRISSRAHLVYTSATLVASLLVGVFFSEWQNLPMLLGIVICGIGVILSFFVFDVEDRIEPNHQPTTAESGQTESEQKLVLPHPIKLSLTIMIFCGLLYGVVDLAQTNSKLLLQYQLEGQLSVDQVVSYLGLAWFVSRIIRILVDLIYPKVHQKFQSKVAIGLSFWVLISIILILTGFFLETDFVPRMMLITSGFILLPAVRDPLHIFCQTALLNKTRKADRRDALVYLVVMQQAGKFLLGLLISAILLFLPVQYAIILLGIASLPVIAVAFRLNRLLKAK